MAQASFIIAITTPDGTTTDVPVKPSTLIALEERMGMPVAQRIKQGFTGAAERLGFIVAKDAGLIPAERTFEDFIDGDDEWSFEFRSPETTVTDAEGNP